MNSLDIQPAQADVNDDIVSYLERMLEDAKSGEVHALACSALRTGSEVHRAVYWSAGSNLYSLLGGLHTVADMCSQYIDEESEVVSRG